MSTPEGDRSISTLPGGLWSQPQPTVPNTSVDEPVQRLRMPAAMVYDYTPGLAQTRFLRGLKEKKILGERCPTTGEVYVGSRGVSPVSGEGTSTAGRLLTTVSVTAGGSTAGQRVSVFSTLPSAGSLVCSGTLDAGLTAALSCALSPGVQTLTATVADAAGNISAPSGATAVVVDIAPGTVTLPAAASV